MDYLIYGTLKNKIQKTTSDISQSVSEAKQYSSNAKQYASDAMQSVADIKQYGTVQITSEEPTNENVDLWINDKNNEEYSLPEIKDNEISSQDTWSSQKIYDELMALKEWVSNQLSS